MNLKFKRLHPQAVRPVYATSGAACFDLRAVGVVEHAGHGEHVFTSRPVTFRTGLAFEIPAGHVLLVFSRSGHGFKNDTRLANCVGVIDSDYRGELLVRLSRHGSEHTAPMQVRNGDRIAQAMLVPIPSVELVECDELGETERGAGGLGSTGA